MFMVKKIFYSELLELYLERIPLKTEAKARKIIHFAKRRNMENLGNIYLFSFINECD